MDARHAYGAAAEALAVSYLEARGLTVLLRNFRRRAGEIDIVALDGETLVIIEVRARSSAAFGGAAASVHGLKRARIIRAAQLLLQRYPAWARRPARFDAILVQGNGDDARIEWIRHAFTC